MDREDYEEFEKMGTHVDKYPEVSGKAACLATEIILDIIKK